MEQIYIVFGPGTLDYLTTLSQLSLNIPTCVVAGDPQEMRGTEEARGTRNLGTGL